MKLLIVHQYFKLPEEGSGIRSWYLANALVKEGHQVDVLSGHLSQSGRVSVGEYIVYYHRIPYDNTFGFVRRLYAFYQFVRAGYRHLKQNNEYDLLYVLSTPLSTGFIGIHALKKYNIPYFFEVGDLWPEAPIQLKNIRNRFITSILYSFEKKIYKNANQLIGLSPEIKKAIEKTTHHKRSVHVATNMSDIEFFTPVSTLPKSFTEQSPFTICYLGAMGQANHLEFLVDFAEACRQHNLPVKFILMGEGAQRNRIMQLSGSLECIEWVSPGGKAAVKSQLDRSHACYVSYAPFPILQTGSPNKLFDGLAAGKLIILNFGGWMQYLIESNNCGFSYNPYQPIDAVEKLHRFIQDSSLLKKAQSNARKVAENEYSVEEVCNKITRLISI